jgi:hypothetical protein
MENREIIETLLGTHKGVNRRSYSKRNLPNWLAAVSSYFRGEMPAALPGDGNLGKFTRSRLAEMAAKMKGGPTPPRH